MTALEILTAARTLLAKGHAVWCMARDAKGHTVMFNDPTAVDYSTAVAVNAAAGDDVVASFNAWQFVRAAFSEHDQWKGAVGSVQDQMTQAEAIAFMDRAIVLATVQTKRGRTV